MTVIDLSRRKEITALYTLQPFVYQFYPNYDYPERASFWSDTFGVVSEQSINRSHITEVYRSPNQQYEEKETQAECIANGSTWYWDNENQLCTVHVEHDTIPLGDDYSVSIAFGLTDDRTISIDDIPYIPVIKSAPQINQSQDLQNYAVPSYITGSIVLDNHDGILDFLIDEPIYGNNIDLYYLDADNREPQNYERTDLTAQASLYIEDYGVTCKEINLRIQDKRKSQNITIPTDLFTITDYPNIEDEFVNTVIPALWGQVKNIPAICTNGKTTSGNVEYRAAIEMTNFGGFFIVVDTDGAEYARIPVSQSVSTGEFVLSGSDARDSNGAPLPCYLGFNPIGIAITKLSDIITDMNNRYLNLTYGTTYYDTTEWEAEDDDISTGGYYLTEEKKLSEAIVEIQNGANIGFRYEILPNGKRTIRADNEDRAVSGTIRNREILNRDIIPIETDSETLIAISSIGYNYDYQRKFNDRYLYDDDADMVETTYRQRPRYPVSGDLQTFLLTSALALEKAQFLSDRFSTIRGIVSLELNGYLDIRIYDIYYIELTPAEFIDGETITGREYFGIRKCKIIETQPNNKDMTNSIKAVIID